MSSGPYNKKEARGPSVGLGPLGEALAPAQPGLTPRPLSLCSAFQNMPNVRDHDASVYLRLQGDGLSVGGYETNPIFWEEVRHTGSGGGVRAVAQCEEPPPEAPRCP